MVLILSFLILKFHTYNCAMINGFTFFLIIIIAFLIIVIWQLLKQKKQFTEINTSLNQRTDKLKKQIEDNHQIDLKELEIQNAISLDYIDFLGNNISALKNTYEIVKDINKSTTIDNASLNKYLCHFKATLKGLIVKFEDIKWFNKIENKSLENIFEHISNFANKTISSNHLDIEVDVKIEKNHITPRYWGRQFYLIIKQALMNSVELSVPRKVKLSLIASKDGHVKVTYRDIEECFKLEKTSVMNGWAKTIKADFSFNSIKQKEAIFTITVCIPLKNNLID